MGGKNALGACRVVERDCGVFFCAQVSWGAGRDLNVYRAHHHALFLRRSAIREFGYVGGGHDQLDGHGGC
jgi:hypothetical protein